MNHDPLALPGPDAGPVVRIRWSEVQWHEASIPLSQLAGAVSSGGFVPGHPMPADLNELAGDPWEHGDLVALLRELQDEDDSTAAGATGLTVTEIELEQPFQHSPSSTTRNGEN
jgi:hypothetical protein